MPANVVYPIKNIANGLLRGRANGETVGGDDQRKRCLWIGSHFNTLLVILVAAVSIAASRRVLASVSSYPEFYIFSHPIIASLLKTGISFNLVTGAAILASGLGFFLLATYLYRDRLIAAAATFFFFFLLPLGVNSPFAERIFSGGGEVLVSLGLALFSSYFFVLFVDRDGKANFLRAVLFLALTGLSSGVGFLFVLCFLTLLGISEIFLGGGRVKIGRIAVVIIAAWLMISFWYHPGFILEKFRMWKELGVSRNIVDLAPIGMVSLPIIGTVTFLLFDRREDLQPVFVALFTSVSCLFFYTFGNTFDKSFVPNPYRFILLAAVPFALLFGVVLGHLIRLFDLMKNYEGFRFPFPLSNFFVMIVFLIMIVLNLPGGGAVSQVVIQEQRWFWLSTGKVEFWFFAGIAVSLFSAVGIIFLMRKIWPKDSYLDRVFSPRGAYEE